MVCKIHGPGPCGYCADCGLHVTSHPNDDGIQHNSDADDDHSPSDLLADDERGWIIELHVTRAVAALMIEENGVGSDLSSATL